MKYVKYIAALCLVVISAASYAQDNDKIKLYTLIHGSIVNFETDVAMVIDGNLIQAKNHPSPPDYAGPSYVEVDSSLDGKEITQAQFNWDVSGKTYLCTAKNLPLYVQAGDFNNGTQLSFDCAERK